MSFFSDGLTWTIAAGNYSAGETVTYYRGSMRITCTAMRGASTFEEIDSEGEVRSLTKSIDWMIDPAELVFNGHRVEPQRGDQVETSSGEFFDVMPGGAGTAWQWSESHRTRYRIHTVRRSV